jgi:hypothetical protein
MSSPRKVKKKISEDGVRSRAALEGKLLLALRFRRLGALVFRPDSFRKSHKVGHLLQVATDSSLGGRSFVRPARGRKNASYQKSPTGRRKKTHQVHFNFN